MAYTNPGRWEDRRKAPRQPQQPIPTHYGRTKIATIRKSVNNLRRLIRAEGTPDIQAAWDRIEPWVDRVFKEDG